MWPFTTFGFFSVVQDRQNKSRLVVRARVRLDLERLHQFIPTLSRPVVSETTDYRYRAWVRRDDFAAAMPSLVAQITYPNFKNEVCRQQGVKRMQVYHKVWDVMLQLQMQEQSDRILHKAL